MYIKKIYHKILSKINKKKYAVKIGVNFKGDLNKVHIYGDVKWGTEPWIISIESDVYITDHCTFITHDGGTLLFRKYVPDLEITKPIVINEKVYIGNNVTILPGVTIGSNTIVAAGAVVTKDLPPNGVYGGVPARFIKTIDDYFYKISKESLHLGHLKGEEKDKALKKYYGYDKLN